MIKLETNVHGVFALKGGKVIIQETFSPDVKEVAEKIQVLEEGFLPEEEKVLKKLADTGNKRVGVTNPKRFTDLGLDIEFVESKYVGAYEIATILGIPHEDTRRLLRRVTTIISRNKIKNVERDQLVIQAVNSLDEIQDAANLLNERLREWYSLHFPELDHLVEGNEAFTRIVAKTGGRQTLDKNNLMLDGKHAKRILSSIDDTLGVDFSEDDLKSVKRLAEATLNVYESKADIEKYIEVQMKEIAPNLTHLAGAQLGARLISIAGSLKRLGVLPAGTIQVLGAEDAFFRFLKSGKKPPKHGVIFQYPDIRGAKRTLRGKLSRTLAAKLAIAARADAYHGDFIAPKLLEQFKKRVKDLG